MRIPNVETGEHKRAVTVSLLRDALTAVPRRTPNREYHRARNRHIQDLILLQTYLEEGNQASRTDTDRQKRSPIRCILGISFVLNVGVAAAKLGVFLSSQSLVVFVSLVDSLVDIVASSVLWGTARAIAQTSSSFRFPIGKARFEPIGTLVFSVVMTFAMVTAGGRALISLVDGLLTENKTSPVLGLASILILSGTVVSKASFYFTVKGYALDSDLLEVSAQDHFNDALSNFASLGVAVIASISTTLWWLDSTGAVLLSAVLIFIWLRSLKEQALLLSGGGASPEMLQKLTLMSSAHNPIILQVDTVRAYHAGKKLFVEVHIVLAPDTPLLVAHNVGESLEKDIERYFSSEVERAFVHVDHESSHLPSSEHCA